MTGFRFRLKQGAGIGLFKFSGPRIVRPGEGPFVIAEQFAFNNGFGKRGAIHHHEGFLGPFAQTDGSLRAVTSLPVPLSPKIKTGTSVGATLPTKTITLFHFGAFGHDIDLNPRGPPA
jgi:hypothetical protein